MGWHGSDVKKYIQNVRLACGVVINTIVVAAARGIVEAHNRVLLSQNGGSINLTREYARSFTNYKQNELKTQRHEDGKKTSLWFWGTEDK